MRVPDGWKQRRLGDVLTLLNGRAYKKDELLDQGTPVLRIQNLNGGDRWYYSNLELPSNKYCDDGDLLFAWSATFGPYIWRGSKCIYHYHIWKIELGPELDKGFAYYLLQDITDAVKAAGRGISMLHMTKGGMEDWLVYLPPLDEQRRIAGILDQADALRRLRARALDKLNTLGQAIFQEMFGGGNDSQIKKLKDVAELINGDRSSNYPSGDEIKHNGILFLSTKNIREWRLDLTQAQFISQEKFATLSRGKLQRGDIIITLRGTLGQAAIFDCAHETGFINAQMMIIRPRAKLGSKYLLDYLAHDRTQYELNKGQSGSAVKQLTAKQVGELSVVVPTLEQQAIYSKKMAACDTARISATQQSNKANTLFTSLQHRAFRGEL